MKGLRTYQQDLFKLKVASCKHDFGWQKYNPKLVEKEHVHFYRNVNENGKELDTSTYAGGHFHKVTVEWNEDGTLKKAVCGPPLHKVTVTLPGSGKKVLRVSEIYFERETSDATKDGEVVEKIFDSHTHEMEFIHMEEVSPEIRNAVRVDTQQKVKGLMSDQAINKIQGMAAAPAPDAGGATITDSEA